MTSGEPRKASGTILSTSYAFVPFTLIKSRAARGRASYSHFQGQSESTCPGWLRQPVQGSGVGSPEHPCLSHSEGTLVLFASVSERLLRFKRPIKMPVNIKKGVRTPPKYRFVRWCCCPWGHCELAAVPAGACSAALPTLHGRTLT